jgi:hypothetical protein
VQSIGPHIFTDSLSPLLELLTPLPRTIGLLPPLLATNSTNSNYVWCLPANTHYLALRAMSGGNNLLPYDHHHTNNQQHHQIHQPHFHSTPPTASRFLLCVMRLQLPPVVNVLHNDDATGPTAAPDCPPRSPGIGDHVRNQLLQTSTVSLTTTDEINFAENDNYHRRLSYRIRTGYI